MSSRRRGRNGSVLLEGHRMLKSVARLKQHDLQAAMNDGNPEAAVTFNGTLELVNPLIIAALGPIYVENVDVAMSAKGAHTHTYSHACSTHSQPYRHVSCACTVRVGWSNLTVVCFVP